MARDWSPVCSAWSDISSMDSASIIAGTLFLLAPADTARSRAASAESRRMLTARETGAAVGAGGGGLGGCVAGVVAGGAAGGGRGGGRGGRGVGGWCWDRGGTAGRRIARHRLARRVNQENHDRGQRAE